MPAGLHTASIRLPVEGQLPSFDGATAWLNSRSTRADLDGEGDGTVVEQRLYQLIRQHGAVTDHIFELTFLDPGVEAYAVTFG